MKKNKRLQNIVLPIIIAVVTLTFAFEAQATNWEYKPGDTVSIIDGKLYAIDQQLAKADAVIQNTNNPLVAIKNQLKWKANLLTDKLKLIKEKNKLEPISNFDQAIADVQNQLEKTLYDVNLLRANDAAAGGAGNTVYESCGFNVPCWIRNGITFIGVIFKEIFGGILSVVGVVFDQSVKFSISEFSSLAGRNDETGNAVQVAWKTLRDVANLFFIFILLYAAIGMILQLPSINGKRILVSVIVVALLINFSAFFTRIVIDASNVAAYQFYKAIGSLGGQNNGGIAAAYMKTLPLGTAFSLTEVAATDVAGLVYEEFGAFSRTTLLAFGTVVMLIIAIFLFLAATILFAVRTVTLIFVIILSPLAFLMYAFPNQKGLFDKWLDTLLKQSFFAPLYLLMVYVSLLVLGSAPLQAQLRASTASFSHLVFYYLIAAGLMFGALIIATKLGAKGASAAMKGAGALTGAAVGAVGAATKYGLRKLGGGAAGWVGEKVEQKAPRVASTLKNIGGGVGKTVKAVEKAVPGVGVVRKGLSEFVKSPLKTTAEGLAMATKDYGVSGILGRTKDEEAEARKKAKEEEEVKRKRQLQEYNDKLERMNEKDVAGAAEIMGKMKGKEIAGLKKKAQLNPAVIFNYTEDDLVAMNREGVDTEIMSQIYEEIRKDSQHKAYDYVTKSPSRARRRGTPQPPTQGATPAATQSPQTTPPSPIPPTSPPSNPPVTPPQPGGPHFRV